MVAFEFGIALAAHIHMQPGSKSGWRTFETDISSNPSIIHPTNISMMPQIERDPSTSLLSNEGDQKR